ncbi:Zn-dependent exopeptidase [Conidiobolus coronatus NRRL 28638]|uniref:Peptide hydrolase n=1 Tax=Conidiobolus coronatus (strain ATCC 28846 / CBS 209.66 / NRRL 28638) TaxID=796925 RepID=A0A137NT30_CONC2|nr:Zn-dependent exopeptidase [Conidiobolus coronatus NRRL 28638]|eukprot:KXN65844.1 Zn-dependent exopeptidase [Conidiobolus coronatus NRRL 28638]
MGESVSDNIKVDYIERPESFCSREAQKFSWKKYALGWVYPLICFIIVLVTFILVKSSLDMTDLPLESELYNPKEGFNAARAHKHLVALSQSPHGFESPKNNLNVEYIINQVKALQDKTDHISYLHDNSSQLVVPQSDKNRIGEGSFSTYFVTSNLLVKFKGSNSNGRAVMLSAHYDSRPITPGASDAGIPVCVSLEILEALIQSPPEGYDVMVNFNNGEELGLLGSLGFKFHPWAKDVDSFINLEASGTGGKAFLFQSSSNSLVKALASGSYRHINGMSNDLFSMGIINSGTDYKVYKDNYNIPGVDIAFYRNRAFYHTTMDDLEHVSIASINQMGNFAYNGVKKIEKYGLSKEVSKVVAFDFFGSSPVYTLTSFYVLIALFFVFEIILLVAYKLKIRHIQPLFTEGRPFIHILKGLLFSILTIIFTAIFGAILIVITNAANKNPLVSNYYAFNLEEMG